MVKNAKNIVVAGGGDAGAQFYNDKVDEICGIIQKWFGAEVSQESVKNILNSVFYNVFFPLKSSPNWAVFDKTFKNVFW